MKKVFQIKGMHCDSCVKLLESDFEGKVISSKIDFKSGKAVIDFDPKKISEDQIVEIIENGGFSVE